MEELAIIRKKEYLELQQQLEQTKTKIEKLKMHIMCIKETIEVWDLDYKDGYVDFEIPKKIRDVVFRSESDE